MSRLPLMQAFFDDVSEEESVPESLSEAGRLMSLRLRLR